MPSEDIPVIQCVVAVMWPSFLLAGIATILFFTAFDPAEILPISGFGEISRLGAYSIGFFLFWLLTGLSSFLTCYFRKPCAINNNS